MEKIAAMKTRLLLPVLATLTGLLLAALFLALPQAGQTVQASSPINFSLTILHTNDIHAHYAAYNSDGSACKDEAVCLGGIARLKTLVDQYRASEPDSILVDAGDQFQGTLYYKLFKADIVTRTMNAMGYQAMAIGNHEFDDGPGMLAKLASGLSFPVLGTNLDVSGEVSLTGKLVTTTVITVDGQKIGLLGLTTPDTSFLSRPGKVVFKDPVASAAAAVAALQAQGVDEIVALTHLGYDQDLALAQAVDGLDVIIGGHSHTFIYTPTVPMTFTMPLYPKYGTLAPAGPYPTLTHSPDGDPVLVATEYCWLAFLGRLKVTFDGAGKVVAYQGDPVYLANSIVKDPGVNAWMAPYDAQVDVLRHTAVGTTTVNLPVLVGTNQVCRTGECLLGDLVTDAMLWKVNTSGAVTTTRGPLDSGDPFQIAILNGGSFRAPLTGTISVGDVLEVLPFGNTIATFDITGTYLLAALESGLSRVGTNSGTGRFPQVAGLRFAFDPWKPAGSRLISVEVKTQSGYSPLNPQQVYRVVTNDYMRSGGDGYTIFRDKAIHPYDFGPALDEAMQDYIKKLGIINPEDLVSGRIFVRYQFFFPIIGK
jgi:5'-nucleotidase